MFLREKKISVTKNFHPLCVDYEMVKVKVKLYRLLECSRTIYNHWLYITTLHSQAGRCIYAYNTHIPIIDYLMQWPIHLHELPTDYI